MNYHEIVEELGRLEQAIKDAVSAKDAYLQDLTAQQKALENLWFDVGGIVTKDGRLWYRVEGFSVSIEDEIRLRILIRRVKKGTNEPLRKGTNRVSPELHYARIINTHCLPNG